MELMEPDPVFAPIMANACVIRTMAEGFLNVCVKRTGREISASVRLLRRLAGLIASQKFAPVEEIASVESAFANQTIGLVLSVIQEIVEENRAPAARLFLIASSASTTLTIKKTATMSARSLITQRLRIPSLVNQS